MAAEDRENFNFKFGSNVAILGIDVVEGGAERFDSMAAALARVKPDIDFVCVHDAARPCLADEWIDSVFRSRRKERRGDPGHSCRRHAEARAGRSHDSGNRVPRRSVGSANAAGLSPRQLLLEAYARRGDFPATDDAQLVERIGHAVTIVPGSPINLKITTREDLRLAEQALKALPKPKFIGPAHPFADDDMWR